MKTSIIFLLLLNKPTLELSIKNINLNGSFIKKDIRLIKIYYIISDYAHNRPNRESHVCKEVASLKKEMIGIDCFNEIHAAEQQKHRNKLRKEKGDEVYKKQQAEYMKAYRQAKKAAKAQQPQQLDIKTPAANILQNAFRNTISRNAVLKQKQDRANEFIAHINKQKATRDFNELKTKLNASIIVNDMLNQLIPSTINLNYPIKLIFLDANFLRSLIDILFMIGCWI
jgi:hypothetical protein